MPPSVLSAIRDAIEHPDNADDLTLSELSKRSLRRNINVLMVKKGKGHFEGVLLDEKGKPVETNGGWFLTPRDPAR
jgi:hypothetical protein